MKVYKMNDVIEWVAAENARDACMVLVDSGNDVYIDGPHELTDDEMNTLKHTGEDGSKEEAVTFKERLDQYVAEGRKFPMHFASTEY